MKYLTSAQAHLASVILVTLLSVPASAFAQGSAQAATTAAARTQPADDETLASAFGPMALAALAVMTLLVRRRPMR